MGCSAQQELPTTIVAHRAELLEFENSAEYGFRKVEDGCFSGLDSLQKQWTSLKIIKIIKLLKY